MAIGAAFCQIMTSATNRQPSAGDGERLTLYFSESFSTNNMGGMYDGSSHAQIDGRAGNNHALGRFSPVSNLILTNGLYFRKGGDGSADLVISGVQIDD